MKLIVCHYWFINHVFKFQNFIGNGGHDLTMLCRNINDITNITVKGVYYHCTTNLIKKSEATHLLRNFVLDDLGYI